MAEGAELFSGSETETELETESPVFLPRTPPVKRPRAETSVRQLLPSLSSVESAALAKQSHRLHSSGHDNCGKGKQVTPKSCSTCKFIYVAVIGVLRLIMTCSILKLYSIRDT